MGNSLSNGDSDVILIVENTKIPAHKSKLIEHSEYFKAMFSSYFIEAAQDEITLEDTNLKAFKRVLEYIHTGRMDYYLQNLRIPLGEVFEVLVCAQYFMVDALISDMTSNLKKKVAPRVLLNYALAHSSKELISYSTNKILKNAKHTDIRIFDQFSPLAVKHFLNIRLDTLESLMFIALVEWMRKNPAYSDSFPKLLKQIDLHLLKGKQMDVLFEPVKLIDRDYCQNLLIQQREQDKKLQKVVNTNFITSISDLCIFEGRKICSSDSTVASVASWHHERPIIIDLKKPYFINCLKFFIKTNNIRKHLRYTVLASANTRNWKVVIDHSTYDCSGQQTLYFKECTIRYIRIHAETDYFIINGKIEALLSTEPFDIHRARYYSTTLIVPKANFVQMKTLSTWNSTISGGFIYGELTDGHIRHKLGEPDSIVYKFSQPYVIDSVKLLLREQCNYHIEVAPSFGLWKRVVAEMNVSGWSSISFKRQPVMYIRIVGTKAPSEYFYVDKLECPCKY
uniref:BTB domain-containing protein n=1 Tax=Panagrellus redivivus TaxID=6233 RepID=A0A7E4ZT48_PANRE